ncbi:MAG TPA: hypothetical protein VEK57_01115 [Thermoanaerobaculia bacterium]|nr:hypothetical protein [Thermoanaerobaculia bacterium]
MHILLLAATILVSDARVNQELERLGTVQAQLEKAELPEMLKGETKTTREVLATALKSQAPIVRLYRLRNAYIYIETLRYVDEHEAAAESFEKLQAFWSARKPEPVMVAQGPLLETALVQASVNRAEVLYRASLPYGKVSGALSGLYYLAEADANASFAQLVRSMTAGDAEAPPTEAKLRGTLEAMEKEMLAAFGKDPVGRPVIGVSVRLKEARELLDRGSLSGATLLLLEARRSLERVTANPYPMPEGILTGPMAALWSALAEEEVKK